MRIIKAIPIAILLLAAAAGGNVSAEDGEGTAVPYYQSRAFNVPMLAGWFDQSGEDFAQFQLAAAQATIRVKVVSERDPIAAVDTELAELTGMEAPQATYRDKVNLADGTWHVLVYDLDDVTTASVMARAIEGQVAVISFIERDPATRTVMLTLARSDASHEDAAHEMILAADALAETMPSYLAQEASVTLPSGEWTVYTGDGLTVMGFVYGNDSYVALQQAEQGDLAALADGYNRTLLGFFITPDNTAYLALALAVVFGILALLVGSLFWRERGLRKDLHVLEALAREEE
jgi:hypothetical protein